MDNKKLNQECRYNHYKFYSDDSACTSLMQELELDAQVDDDVHHLIASILKKRIDSNPESLTNLLTRQEDIALFRHLNYDNHSTESQVITYVQSRLDYLHRNRHHLLTSEKMEILVDFVIECYVLAHQYDQNLDMYITQLIESGDA